LWLLAYSIVALLQFTWTEVNIIALWWVNCSWCWCKSRLRC